MGISWAFPIGVNNVGECEGTIREIVDLACPDIKGLSSIRVPCPNAADVDLLAGCTFGTGLAL